MAGPTNKISGSNIGRPHALFSFEAFLVSHPSPLKLLLLLCFCEFYWLVTGFNLTIKIFAFAPTITSRKKPAVPNKTDFAPTMYVTYSACAGALRVMYYQWRGTRRAGTCAMGSKYWCAAGSYFSSSG
jgi:hypothetical protein